jgi:hypothetical protein
MRTVFLDPDGTNKDYFGVIIRHPSGVVYSQQCGCTKTEIRSLEGYFVPLGREPFESGGRPLSIAGLTAIFHRAGIGTGEPLSDEARSRLASFVENIPWWDAAENRTHLAVDEARRGETMEAWVPVITSDGPGILTWPNCD